MKKRLKILAWMILVISSCGQSNQLLSDKVPKDIVKVDSLKMKGSQLSVDTIPQHHIYKEYKYSDVSGKNIIIQNSFPKGGGQIEPGGLMGYYDWQGNHYGHIVFWTRIINETAKPLEININFPVNFGTIPNLVKPSFRFFLPPNTITLDQLPLYNYGLTGIKNHIDDTFHHPPQSQKTIPPHGTYMFYISMLVFDTEGSIRNGFILKEEELFYNVSFTNFGSTLLPVGHIRFKKE